jgi:hypothetical protein
MDPVPAPGGEKGRYTPPVPRYAALLRGVSPMNARMPALKRAFEAAGFADVETVLGSGNVVFSARPRSIAALERQAEAAMQQALGRCFLTIVRPLDRLQACAQDGEVFSAYVPGPRGPVFMALIEKTLGRELTTRTWDTVTRIAGRTVPRGKREGRRPAT